MKTKILLLALLCLLASSILLSKDFSEFTPEEAAKWIKKRVSSYYGRVDVVIKKEKEGISFHFKVERRLESMDDVYDFFKDVAVYVGEITSKTKWRSNKVAVFFKGKLMAWISTRHCREAIKPKHDLDRMDFIISKLRFPEK